ncbi:MAG: bacillithiol biosynthesis deacetylase BshB1 [Acidobacteriota bacterium]
MKAGGKLDVLAFGAHPDDVELQIGGTILKLANMGYRVGVADMTRGELGTRGTPAIRAKEARRASSILKLAVRENLSLKDGSVLVTPAARLKVVALLRRYRPALVLTHYWDDRHPDHVATSRLVTDCCYLSGLQKIKTSRERFRPDRLLYFGIPHFVQPSFLIDISSTFEGKMEAIKAFRSQMHDPNSKEPQTYLSVPDFLPNLEAVNRYYGTLIQVRHAEAFVTRDAIAIGDPIPFFCSPGEGRCP